MLLRYENVETAVIFILDKRQEKKATHVLGTINTLPIKYHIIILSDWTITGRHYAKQSMYILSDPMISKVMSVNHLLEDLLR